MNISLFKSNIRQKVLLALLAFLFGIGTMAFISFSNLKEIEKKVVLVEVADDLTNIVLEIRRTEKNLLLYGEKTNLEENRRYTEEALSLLKSISTALSQPSMERELSKLKSALGAYAELFETLTMRDDLDEAERLALVDSLRENGKLIMEQSKEIAHYERGDILRINDHLQKNLLISVLIMVVMGLAAFMFVIFKIVLPLRMIEQTTSSIAKGDFQPLKVSNTNDEIQRVMEALNRMVAELDKRRDQLVQSQKLSSIGTLASGIAHQLNNPLNNISTSCQILMEDTDADQEIMSRMLTNIEQETFRARDIVRELLEFSRQQEFSPGRLLLAKVVERSVRLTSSQVPPNIKVSMDIPEGLEVSVDFHRMQEALINLILNAVQAIENSSGEVTLTARDMPDNDTVLLTVRDNGKGISPEDMARIFDPFFTTKEVGVGTGLGLYMVYGIIKMQRGRIWVESAPGQGTAFHMELPKSEEADDA